MGNPATYDERAIVIAYLDAQRPAYPHEDFRTFRRSKLAALEAAYRIRISYDGLTPERPSSLWMLFQATADSFLKLGGPRAGFLDDSLINVTLERVDTPELALRETETKLYLHLDKTQEAHLELLTKLFRLLWGPIENPCTPADLARVGFDAGAEPKLHDYFDDM